MFTLLSTLCNKHITKATSVPKGDTTNPENHIFQGDPNNLNFMVSHYDCAKGNSIRQFSLLNIHSCKQAPSDIQNTRTQATVQPRAKPKRIKTFEIEACVKTENVWCSQTYGNSRRYDHLHWEQNTLELPKILDRFECKHLIIYVNATDSNELNKCDTQCSFTVFDGNDCQIKLESVQPPFSVEQLNAGHIGSLVYDEDYPSWILNFTHKADTEHLITRKSWRLRLTNAENI